MDTVKDIVPSLTKNERTFLAAAINHYSEGGHPVADDKNLPHFTAKFARECMERTLSDPASSPRAKMLANSILSNMK